MFCAGVFAAVSVGLVGALGIYINTYFWELTATKISVIVLGYFLSALLAVAITPQIARRLGKKWAAMITSLVAILIWARAGCLAAPRSLPAERQSQPASAAVRLRDGDRRGDHHVGHPVHSMVADIVEENEVATGRRSEGVFVAANSFVQKAASGIGIFGSSLLLGAIGFPRDAEPGQVAPEVIHRLGVVFAPTIVVLNLIALAFLSTYGISRASHEANLRRLDRA